MTHPIAHANTVVGVFDDESDAQRAIGELKSAGFTDQQIGVMWTRKSHELVVGDGSGKVATAGAVAGVGLGTLWGLAILAGILPGIGPAIAGGTLGVLMSSAAAGAAGAGLAGALIGLGVPDDDAQKYEKDLKSGKTIVTVNAGSRSEIASRALFKV
jgi:hypothetical protein